MSPEAVENFQNFIRLVPLGFAVSAYGSLIGAGGGFLLVPLLILLMPGQMGPGTVTSISLTVVFFNAYAGTLAYARMKRIHYYYGLLFSVAGLPAVVIGTTAVRHVSRRPFAICFGLLLAALGVYLTLRPLGKRTGGDLTSDIPCNGFNREQRKRIYQGVLFSAYARFGAGLLGIGGGIVQVPFLIKVMRFSPHVATATSLFILAISCFVGVASHAVQDFLHPANSEFFIGLDKAAYLSVGALMGAPLGAFLSQKIRGSGLVRLLALALVLVGGRLFWKAISGQV